jgi:hypothetical protein
MFQAMEYKELLAAHKKALAEYSVLQKKKAPQLKQLWEVWKDTEVADIDLPPPPLAPSVPEPGNTALGRTVKRKFDKAIMVGDNLLNEEDFLELAEKYQRIAQQKGITIAFNNNNRDQTQNNIADGMEQAQCDNIDDGERAQRNNADNGEQSNMERAQDDNTDNGEQAQHANADYGE